jgi:unsaturated rhamnogalacturonyl hydrolase
MTKNYSLEMARSVINRYQPAQMRWHYEHGLVITAILEVGEYYQRTSFFDWAYSMYDPFIKEDGTIKNYRAGENNLDMINPGRNLFFLHEKTGEQRFIKAAHVLRGQLINQPRTRSGIYWHKQIYPWQVWLDGVYMQGPFSALYAKHVDQRSIIEDLVAQIEGVYATLRDSGTGLLYHAWDESRGMRWSDIETGLSPHFWGRALGWYAMAVVDIIAIISTDNPLSDPLKKILNTLMGDILAFQQPDGMFCQVVDRGEAEGNYKETSASAMFAYTLLRMVSLEINNDSKIQACALKALDGIEKRYLSVDEDGEYHLGDICSVAGLGGNPYRDGSLHYCFKEPQFVDDFKGVGPYILAALEREKLSK